MSVVALASVADVRGKVLAQFRYSPAQVNALADQLASLNTLGYADRMADIARSARIGVTVTPDRLADSTFARLTHVARTTAQGVAATHDADLRAFVSRQLQADSTLSQADLSRLVRQWENDRAEYKPEQIARTQGMWARHEADRDVISRNGLTTRVRIVGQAPQDGPCLANLARGWMSADDAASIPLPTHPACQCRLSTEQSYRTALAGQERVWLGDWIDRKQAA